MGNEIERYISQKERDQMPESDFAGHGTDFPIPDQAHLDAAVKDMGRESPEYQAHIKQRIIEIAKRKGLSLPESWQKKDGSEERMAGNEEPTNFSFYAPFVRIADKQSDKREVVGKATRGTPIDTYGTVITYDASKKAFSRAKRIPLREMHQNKAVGKGLEWWGDDKNEDIFLHSYISRAANDTWTKVEEDILVGYSIKGQNAKYGTIVRDGKSIPAIVDYDLVEVSLVDNPSCPGCDIAVMRGDGIEDVIASDEELTELSNKEQQSVASNETSEQSFERAGAVMSAANRSKLHTSRDAMLSMCADAGCDECRAVMNMASDHGDGDDIPERVERAMAPVYSRMQAMLGDFARRSEDNTTFARTLTQIAGTLEQLAQKAELDKVLADLAAVKGQVERMAATPMPGGPHTGRSAQKHLATDGPASPADGDTPELMRQINKAGVNLTPAQQTQLVAASLKRI